MKLRSSSNGWRGLALVVFVLLVHLWLLHAADIQFESAADTAPTELKFLTRTLDAPTPLAPAPVPPPKKRQTALPPKPQAAVVPTTAQPPAPPTTEPLRAADAPTGDGAAPATQTENRGDVPGQTQDAAHAVAPQETASDATAATPPAPDLAATSTPKPPHERPLNVSAEALSGSTRLVYVVNTNKFPYRLSSELLWRNNGDSYSTRLRFSAFGQARVQTSRGRIGETGLAPERFSDKYRSEVAAHFNYTQGKVTFSANTPDAPLLAGAQDRLSVLIQLGAILGSEPERFTPGVTLTIPTVGPRNAELWLFEVVGTEALTLPGGAIDAVKLERLPRELYDQKVELWLSPRLSYLPARIRITESNGNSIDQQWQATEAAADAE